MDLKTAPLASRIRPENIDEILGQDHILGTSSPLRRSLENGKLFSIIFWGPPGSGKTTIARVIAKYCSYPFESFSAVLSGVKDLREIVSVAKKTYSIEQKPTLLFVDEIHRFNKAQQDAFLPHIESGLIILVGATTQNPSFEIIPPLLSRTRVMILKPLGFNDMSIVLNRAAKDKQAGLGKLNIDIQSDTIKYIIGISHGDARIALNNLESACLFVRPDKAGKKILDLKTVTQALNKKLLTYDKDGEEHYNLISALHKSLRGNDPQASLYWMYRMLEAGEDPLFIGRRLIRFASEDIGLADPKALEISLACYQAWEKIGPPEARLSLAQAVVYLATAPKSNALYIAEKSVKNEIKRSGSQPVPLFIRNAPTKLMKDIGYSSGYVYPHDHPEKGTKQNFLPEIIRGKIFYRPKNIGFEKEISRRLNRPESIYPVPDKTKPN